MNEFLIDSVNKSVVFNFKYNKDIVRRIKGCGFDAHWNSELKRWIVPINDYTKLRVIKVIKDFNFKQTFLKEDDEKTFDYSIDDNTLKTLNNLCENRFTYTPRLYQLQCLKYNIDKKNIIIGDDVGIGKTFEAIMYTEVFNLFPCLVIVPASVKYNWAEKWREIVKEKRSISVIESRKNNDWNADVIIINYDIIGKKKGTGATVRFPELVEKEWKNIIADEAHFLKSSKSQRTKAAFKIMKTDASIQLLTGTATMNRPIELWNLLRLVKNEKNIADNWKVFSQRYCGGYQSNFGWKTDGATKTIELNRKMRESCYIRREKSDVLKELPKVTKQIIWSKITNKKDYLFAEDNFIEFITQNKGEESADKAREAEVLVALSTMRKLSIEGKIKYIEQYLKDWKESGSQKLIVFGIHKDELTHLAQKFKSKLISGGVSSKKKQEIVNEFKNNDDLFLFLNIQSGGTGIDGLQESCSNILFTELPWRPSDLEQAIGRLDRSGQKLPVTVTFLLSKDTIDIDMWDMLSEKELVIEAVNKGIDIKNSSSSMKNMIKLIKNRKNIK